MSITLFLNYSCLTVLCQFLLYSKVTQSYIYRLSFSHYLPSCSIPRDWTLLLFFFFGLSVAYGVPGQGSDLSLILACGSAGSFNPLCQAGDWTCLLVLQRCCWSRCTTARSPYYSYNRKKKIGAPPMTCKSSWARGWTYATAVQHWRTPWEKIFLNGGRGGIGWWNYLDLCFEQKPVWLKKAT